MRTCEEGTGVRRAALRGRTIILGYHRVAELDRDPHSLCVAPSRFAEHLQVIAKHAEIVPLRTVREKSVVSRAVITFDDGYVDNASVVAPILDDLGVPATFFLASGTIGSPREYWWDKLESLLLTEPLSTDHLEIEIGTRCYWIDVRTDAARQRAVAALWWRLVGLPVPAIQSVLARLADAYGLPDDDRTSHRVMNEHELLDLGPQIEIGAHSVSHPLLLAVNPDEQRVEISESRAALEQLTGQPVTSFAYPYGAKGAFDARTVKLVERAGFALACSGFPGLVSRRQHPLRLPRYFPMDWDADRFSWELSNWLDGTG